MSLAPQIEQFRDYLPRAPYQSNNLKRGIYPRACTTGNDSRYIQPNGPTHKRWLVFDIDKPDAAMLWEKVGGPKPNIVVINKENGHAHYLYQLDTPVRTAADGLAHPVRYMEAIQQALEYKLQADLQYAELVCKNPLNDHWLTYSWRERPYSLGELADYVDLTGLAGKAANENELGRNCQLFDLLRHWAYRAIRQGWPSYERWLTACLDRCEMLNGRDISAHSRGALPFSEVKSIATSVARYTYRRFNPTRFRQNQAERGAKGGKAKGRAYAGRKAKALAMLRHGTTKKAISEALNVHRNTVLKWSKCLLHQWFGARAQIAISDTSPFRGLGMFRLAVWGTPIMLFKEKDRNLIGRGAHLDGYGGLMAGLCGNLGAVFCPSLGFPHERYPVLLCNTR